MKTLTPKAIPLLVISLLILSYAQDTPPAGPLTSDLTLDKGSGKFKYKSDIPDEAKQGWKIKGSCPTAFTSFWQIIAFRIKAWEQQEDEGLIHFFYMEPWAVLDAEGTRYKQPFTYVIMPRAGEAEYTKKRFGFFKAIIKDGLFTFMYSITKAQEGGLLTALDRYEEIKQEMSEQKKVKANAELLVSLEIGPEIHDNLYTAKFTAKKKAAKGKFIKQ
jgi:hypothetical protein